jgi:hypothetical protein
VLHNRLADLEAKKSWNKLRRALFWQRLQNTIGGREGDLWDFNDISRRLHLRNAAYRGVQVVPLDHIVGSVGRYQDFTRSFLPKNESLGERWRGVAAATLDPSGKGLPPVELYKASEWYFVRDGNHRCSVARALKMTTIEAYVWEYTDALPPHGPDDNLERLLVEAERREFLEQTRLAALRPDFDLEQVRLTLPGGYTEMLLYIANYQDVLREIDGVAVSYGEAVVAWFEMVWEPSIQLIHDSGVLRAFPEHTAADLFVWIMQHRREIRSFSRPARQRSAPPITSAVRTYQRRHRRRWLRRIQAGLARFLYKLTNR